VPGGLEIRPCSTGELDALEAAMPSPGRNRFHHRRLLEQLTRSSTYLVAWRDGTPVGHLNLRWRSAEPAVRLELGDAPEINALGVALDAQRQGVAIALIAEAERLADEAGEDLIGLAVNVANAGALRLYDRAGYRDWGRGALDLSWSYVDGAGALVTEVEHCAYLVKPLTESCDRWPYC
jgi:GNAT superfamily N-acetyltransferase